MTKDNTCKQPFCERPRYAKGICQPHLKRLERHGDVDWTKLGIEAPALVELHDATDIIHAATLHVKANSLLARRMWAFLHRMWAQNVGLEKDSSLHREED